MTTNYLYPLRLHYMVKSAIWGGHRLSAYGKQTEDLNMAETWELACREKENAMIENGPLAGMALRDYFRDFGTELIGKEIGKQGFPLLVKLIDAKDDLSVQVHPDDAYAARVEHDRGKTEAWHILEAETGASIIYGLTPGTTPDDFREAVGKSEFSHLLCRVPVKPGDTFFIPSGMVHAIGKGVLLAEVQQNSDLTYRVYDYDRRDKEGNTRPLHLEKAMDVIRPFTEEEVTAARYARTDGVHSSTLLADCPYFCMQLLPEDTEMSLTVGEQHFIHLLCLAGETVLTWQKEEYLLQKGDSWLLPAGLGECQLKTDAKGRVLLSHP